MTVSVTVAPTTGPFLGRVQVCIVRLSPMQTASLNREARA